MSHILRARGFLGLGSPKLRLAQNFSAFSVRRFLTSRLCFGRNSLGRKCTIEEPTLEWNFGKSRRSLWTYKEALKKLQWKFLKAEMIEHFSNCEKRDSALWLRAENWPRFASKLDLTEIGKLPCIISKYGTQKKICLDRNHIEDLAFDEQDGHLSLLFQARLLNIYIEDQVEQCLVQHVQADPVAKRLYFLDLARHVPGNVSVINLPISMVGMIASSAFIKGYHVELAMPTVKVEAVGENIPPPLMVDVSKLSYTPPYSAITLKDIKNLLPEDGTARFSREYEDLSKEEVVWAYEVGTLPDVPLPDDYVDPNFLDKKGRRMSLTYKNYFPKQ